MRKSPQPILITLSSGLRLVHRRDQGASVDYCGVIAGVGAREDGPDCPGLAHFVEHTIFKGTHKRSAWHILNRMESIGGELNAYTTKEETVVYCAAPASHHLRAIELIADLVCHSRFPENELRKERDVVSDEINSYLDSPAEAIIDDFEDSIFAGTPLGHNILGTEEALSRFTSECCRDYLQRCFNLSNIVVFYCGPCSAERIAKAVEKYFSQLPKGEPVRRLPVSLPDLPFDRTKRLHLHQAHVAMGAIAPSMRSPERFAFSLLNNILGGPGMNSLLNLDLREHRGLVYTVESNLGLLSNTGLMCIYYGCDPEDAELCRQLILERLHSLASDPLSERFVRAAKKQYIGQLAVASDNRESTIISSARAALTYGSISPTSALIERINSITSESLRSAAEKIIHPSVLTFAP